MQKPESSITSIKTVISSGTGISWGPNMFSSDLHTIEIQRLLGFSIGGKWGLTNLLFGRLFLVHVSSNLRLPVKGNGCLKDLSVRPVQESPKVGPSWNSHYQLTTLKDQQPGPFLLRPIPNIRAEVCVLMFIAWGLAYRVFFWFLLTWHIAQMPLLLASRVCTSCS